MDAATTGWPSIRQVSKARPWGWSLGRAVPKTSSGCPDLITLIPIVYERASESIAQRTLSCTWPAAMSARAAGGRSMRGEASTCAAGLSARTGGPGVLGWTSVTRHCGDAATKRTSKVQPRTVSRPASSTSHWRIGTSTLAEPASRPPYWASITWATARRPPPTRPDSGTARAGS